MTAEAAHSSGAATGSWGVNIPLGEGWFDLPVGDHVDPADLEARVDARLEREPDLGASREALVAMLAHFTADAHRRGAVGAALYWKRHDLDIVNTATMYTTVSPRPEGTVEDEILRLRSHLEERHASDRTDPVIEHRDLPAGSALRVQVITVSDLTSGEGGNRAALLETIQYWIPVPGRPQTLLLVFSTPNLAAVDAMAAEIDQIAHHLELRM